MFDNIGPEVPLRDVIARRFVAPAPNADSFHGVVRPFASTEPVAGCVVGVADGAHTGWWGPVPESTATDVLRLWDALATAGENSPTTPGRWAARLRRATRHSHSGALAVAAGAFELACWDLAGIRADAPVWWVVRPDAALSTSVESYVTCFGVPELAAVGVAHDVSGSSVYQKWKAPWPHRPDEVAAFVEAVDLDGRVALDFHGRWSPADVRSLCERMAVSLAWVEEPYAPEDVWRSSAGEFGAAHAAGEHCYNPGEAATVLAGRVDIWQPDAVFCGGFASLLEIVELARRAGVRCMPHGGGFLPAVHAATVTTFESAKAIELVEHHLLIEPRRQAHLDRAALPLDDGSVKAPELPGWAGPLRAEVARS